MAAVTINDETATGRVVGTMTLSDLPHRVTVRELVRLRVRDEVAKYNARPDGHFHGLVRPTDTEIAANGYAQRRPRRVDWEKQADVAEAAFARNGFFVLIGDHQVESLDETVELTADTQVAFVRLTPLVGG